MHLPTSKASVGANPDIASLIRATTNAATPAGLELPPPVAVGMVLRDSPQGDPIAWPYHVPIGGKAYLTATLDVDFRATDLSLWSLTKTGDADVLEGVGLVSLLVTSWTSNGIRDQNLLSETGINAEVFNANNQRRFGFDVAPTDARQQIVIELQNQSRTPVAVVGVLAGHCGDCNTLRRGA